MREFSFGKSTPPEEEADTDPGSTLNLFYAKTQKVQPVIVKEENPQVLIKTDEPQFSAAFRMKLVLSTCRATSKMISATFRTPLTPEQFKNVFRPKQKKNLKKMLFSSDDLMFLAS